MSNIHEWREDYRHYRSEHPQFRWLFLLGDLLGLLVKLALFAGFAYMCWYLLSRNPAPEQQVVLSAQPKPTVTAPELTAGRIALLEKIASQGNSTASGLVGSVEFSSSDLSASTEGAPVVQVESRSGIAARSGYVEVDEIPTVYLSPSEAEPEDNFFQPPSPTESSAWVRRQKAGDYTIQLALTVNVEFLVEFAKLLPPAHVAAIYPERRLSKKHLQYSLSLGSFPSLESSEKMLSSLPNNLKRYGAHSRVFDDIHKNLDLFVR